MSYHIFITNQAENDLDEIGDYIAHTLLNPLISLNLINNIKRKILTLNNFPERFPLFSKEPWKSRGLRKMVADQFIVFYISDIQEKVVTIIRILYAGRNIDDFFS